MARTQVQSELLAVNSISGTIIADNAITATHIATNAISGTLVQDGGIVTVMIAANNVTATKIVTDAIQTRHIADDQVTEAKLANAINTSIAAKLPLAGGTMTGDLILGDNVKLEVGSASGGDLQIYHDGSNSYIDDAGTGDLIINATALRPRTDLFVLNNAANNKNQIVAQSGAIKLFYDGAEQLETVSGAVKINNKLGIGTPSPAQFLSVHGNVNFNTTNTDGNESRHLFVMGGSADPGTYSIYDAAENVKVKFNAGGDSYVAGGSFHIGSTDSIASSAEIFSVYNASTGHSKMVNNSDSYGTLYMHNEATTADTFQPFIIMQKGGGNRGNIGVRHTDSVLGLHGQGAISLRTSSTSLQASSERLEIGGDGFIKFGKGCGFGSLHNTGQNVTTSFANYFDFSDLAVGSGQERGMYLVALSRNGGSVGTRLLAFIGISTSQTVYVYEILASATLSIQGSGSNLQVRHTSSGTQSIQGTAIPVAIDHN